MSREQHPLTSRELMVLLNRFAAEHKRIRIKAPHLDAVLLEFDPRTATMTHGITRAAYNALRNRATKESALAPELPSWSDLEQAMRAAGLISFENQDEVQSTLRAFEEEGLNPSRPKLVYLGLDTNMLYHRWASRHLEALLGGHPRAIRCVLSKGTRSELDAQAKAKYSPDEVQLMVGAWGHPAIVNQFTNLKGYRNRLAHNAMGDYEALIRHRRAAEAPCEATTGDKEENDRKIAASYADFETSHRATVTMITGDAGMLTHADATELRTMHVQYGRHDAVPTGPVDERHLLHFIHDLAVAFLVVEMEGTSIQVWGDWGGKRPSQWNTETVRLTYASEDSLAVAAVRDLRTCDLIAEAQRNATAMVRIYQPPSETSEEKAQQAPIEAQGAGLSTMMELVARRRANTVEGLAEQLGIELPPGMLQMDDCVKDALLSAMLRRDGRIEEAEILATRVQNNVLATAGRDFLLKVISA